MSDLSFLALSAGERAALTSELDPGEHILWAGRPDWRRGIIGTLALLVFGLGWSGITFPVAFHVWAGTLGLFGIPRPAGGHGIMGFGLGIFMLPFVAIGAGLLAASIWAIARPRRSLHAVTDRRLVTLVQGRRRAVDSQLLDSVSFINRREHRDGRGSLSIGVGVSRDSDGDPRAVTMEWMGIANAAAVERIIREARRERPR